jgi:hypothetical protein
LRKAVLRSFVWFSAGIICLSALGKSGSGQSAWGQSSRSQEPGEVGGIESFGVSSTWSPDSSHILIGASEQRRIWSLGVEFTHRLSVGRNFRLDYEGSLLPLFEDTDPVVLGSTVTIGGQTIVTPQTPLRVVQVLRGPVGTLTEGTLTAPIYAVFGRQDTYAWSLAPLGVRVSAFPRWRIQPSLSLDTGFVVSHRDIPIDDSDQFNYMFSFGPGVQLFANPKTSWRLEYFYRHLSNAHEGYLNPGIDQGVVRVTLSTHR